MTVDTTGGDFSRSADQANDGGTDLTAHAPQHIGVYTSYRATSRICSAAQLTHELLIRFCSVIRRKHNRAW
jgi:hypothetical protein